MCSARRAITGHMNLLATGLFRRVLPNGLELVLKIFNCLPSEPGCGKVSVNPLGVIAVAVVAIP